MINSLPSAFLASYACDLLYLLQIHIFCTGEFNSLLWSWHRFYNTLFTQWINDILKLHQQGRHLTNYKLNKRLHYIKWQELLSLESLWSQRGGVTGVLNTSSQDNLFLNTHIDFPLFDQRQWAARPVKRCTMDKTQQTLGNHWCHLIYLLTESVNKPGKDGEKYGLLETKEHKNVSASLIVRGKIM